VEAAGELVHEAAARHAIERRDEHAARVRVAARALEEEEEVGRRGELRRVSEAAPLRVEAVGERRLQVGREIALGQGVGAAVASACSIASATRSACCRISGRRSSQLWRTLCSTRAKPGRPAVSRGGKYVPPKKGLRSGVRKSEFGQPPDRVMSCVAVM
jgi:hypothetical protein